MKYALEKVYISLEELTAELIDHPDTPASQIVEILEMNSRRLRAQREMIDQGIEL